MYTQEQWQKWLEESPDKSLVDLLEGFYQGFGLADYLDQIGVIDDRIDKIVEELESIKAEAGSISTMVIIQRVINLIDSHREVGVAPEEVTDL
jgi:hypothetical protein